MNIKNGYFRAFSLCIFFTLLISSFFTKFFLNNSNSTIKNFSKHIMSNATFENINISSKIANFYILFLCVILLNFMLFFIINKMMNKDLLEDYKQYNDFAIIGIASIIGSYFSSTSSLETAPLIIAVVIIIRFLIRKQLQTAGTTYYWVIFISFPLATYLSVILSISFILIYFFVCLALIIGLRFISDQKVLITASIPLLFTSIFQSIMLEVYNIINIRADIVLDIPVINYSIIMILAMAASFFRYKKQKNKQEIDEEGIVKKFHSYYIPLNLISFGLLLAQPFRTIKSGEEMFEIANHGLAIDHLFRYGSLPFIENYDAHMLYNQIFGYIYSALNGYEPWAFSLYDPLVIIFHILLLYSFLNKFIGHEKSFFLILTFPLLFNLFNQLFIFSYVMVMVLIKFKGKKLPYYLFWMSSILLCLYRLDLGFSSIASGLLVFCYLCFFYDKKQFNFFNIITSGFISLLGGLSIFTLLCLLKGISPINRIIEFLEISNSNQNWAYSSYGDPSSIQFILGYFIIPLSGLFGLIWVSMKCLQSRKFKQNNQIQIISFLFFLGFYFFNFPRGIVRHSLLEGSLSFVLSTFSFALLAFIFLFTQNKKVLLIFLAVSMIFVLFTGNLKTHKSFYESAIHSLSYKEQYEEPKRFLGSRLEGSIPIDANHLKQILNTILAPEETYFDFASVNYYYALVERKNPVYVNQSPLLISGDKSQNYTIEQIQNSNSPIVIMPIPGKSMNTIDSISIDYKYYKISEYIYENYEPFIRLNNIDLYSIKSKTESFKKSLNGQKLSFNFIDKQPEVWNRQLGYIPLLWANDMNNIPQSPQFEQFQQVTEVDLNVKQYSKNTPTFLIIEIDSSKKDNMLINLKSKSDLLGQFNFYLKEGKHQYAILLSTDLKWWNGEVEFLTFSTTIPISITNIVWKYDDKFSNFQSQHLGSANLNLSDINDDNWSRGVSSNGDILLFEKNPINQYYLKTGRTLKYDESMAKIKDIVYFGDTYIHVFLDRPIMFKQEENLAILIED
ncbi:hypothetical protein [Paenibacillus mesotrionivorans]|uniref:Uncharacterized protein n=1 Tax=Paenibacillus mesotrionivorans TaxID=3160968 RepID=A0ACC7NXD4_9BACL